MGNISLRTPTLKESIATIMKTSICAYGLQYAVH